VIDPRFMVNAFRFFAHGFSLNKTPPNLACSIDPLEQHVNHLKEDRKGGGVQYETQGSLPAYGDR
jgi:hypothetical protein